ncbi:cardiolipin synthase [Pseudoneobacillus sp. C159]
MNITFSIFGIIYLIIFWLIIDYYLGRRRHLKTFSPPATPTRLSHVEIFNNGEILFADFFHEIAKATKHIHISFYIAKKDAISRQFFKLLITKAQEGVEVRLLLDALGSLKADRQLIRQLKEAGGEFAFSHKPKLPYLFYSLQVRNHRKITVIDGAIGYLGGYNIGNEYVNRDPKLTPWRDYHLKIAGQGVADIQKEFLLNWQEATKHDLQEDYRYFPNPPSGPVEHRIVPTEAVRLEPDFIRFIASAKTSVTIGTPYFIPTPRLLRALLMAAKRGVTVKILVPKMSDHILVKEASFPFFRILLLEKNVEVYQFLNGFYHAKIIIIDDEFCDIGTANFDKRSFYLNYEINCYLYDQNFISKFKEMIAQDFKNSKPLTLEELNQPNLWRSTKEKVASAFSLFL